MAKKSPPPPTSQPESPGKFLITVGGLTGFAATFLTARYAGQVSWTTALLMGSLCCFVSAFAMKRLAIYLEKNIDAIRKQRYQEERARRKRLQEEEERKEQLEDEMLDTNFAIEESSSPRLEG